MTYRGRNVKVQYGAVGVVQVTLQTFHHSVNGHMRAMNGNSYGRCAFTVLLQIFSHSCNEQGLPHPCSSGRYKSDT